MAVNLKIKHRVNTIEQLLATESKLGVEIDLRPYSDQIILNHEPFESGVNIKDFLAHYRHAFIILNTKSEGMEMHLLKMMEAQGIDNFFFLDLSLPYLVKTIKLGCKKVAVRFSEYEPLEFVSKFEGKAEWVWIDCFTKNILSENAYKYLSRHFKTCIVSPELQGHPLSWIDDFKSAFAHFKLDAVCTKHPELW